MTYNKSVDFNRILLALPQLKEGGVERHVLDLAQELVQRNYTVGILAHYGTLFDRFSQTGANLFNLPVHSKNPLIFFSTLPKVKSVIKEFRPEIIHVHSRVPAWHLWLTKGNLPFVTTCHGMYKQSFFTSIMYKGYPTIGVSHYCLSNIPNAFKTKYPYNVVYNGINLHPIELIDKPAALNNLGEFCNPEGCFIIGTVARLTKLKRIDILIKAVAQITTFRYKLIIIGNGPELKNLLALAQALNISDNVVFIKARVDLIQLVPAFNVFVNPCPVEGGTSYSVLEAMDLLVPCIGADSGGVAELIKPNANGLLFQANNPSDLAEKITYLYNHSASAQELVKNARELLQNDFSVCRMVDKILLQYQLAINRR